MFRFKKDMRPIASFFGARWLDSLVSGIGKSGSSLPSV